MPAEGWIAGFDAGQTHTTCRLAEAHSGRVVAQGTGPGVCHLAAPAGPQRFREALGGSLEDALDQLAASAAAAHPQPHADAPTLLAPPPQATSQLPVLPGEAAPSRLRLLAAAIGASGIEMGSAVQRQGLELAAEALGLPRQSLWVGGDERTALRGAFPDGPGIVVISGTGTIAVGRDGQGLEHRCSGWGWILDGAGSAYDIGRDALALTLRMADGRVPRTALHRRIWQALQLDPEDPASAQAIKARVVQPGFAPAGLAALAPVLEAVACEGDPEARGVLQHHAQALVESVCGVARGLQLDAPAVATLGGAITHLQVFRGLFCERLRGFLPEARLQAPAGDATSGALAIAAAVLD
ncbi:MAG: BadF/BadG/BcrA/BcrD ATPase family protein [Cyanobium sp.]